MSADLTTRKIGHLLDGTEERDAIHVAVLPAVAKHSMRPGDHVAIKDGLAHFDGQPIGIVDPFLPQTMRTGDKFFVFLYPGSISSLRHAWTHAELDAQPVVVTKSREEHVAHSEAFMTRLCVIIGIARDDLMEAADRWLASHDHTVQQGSERWRDDFGDPIEFWHHYEILTGKTVNEQDKQSFFCCSC